MSDKLDEVLEAYSSKGIVPIAEGGNILRLVSFCKPTPHELRQLVRDLQEWIQREYKIELSVVGGGFGCAQVNLEIHHGEQAVNKAVAMLSDSKFHKRCAESHLALTIVETPTVYERVKIDPETGIEPEDIPNIPTHPAAIPGHSSRAVATSPANIDQNSSPPQIQPENTPPNTNDDQRNLDVLLTGTIEQGHKITVSAIVRLLGSKTVGQIGKRFQVTPSAGPIRFQLEAEGFVLLSPNELLRNVPANSDSEPASFILEVLPTTQRSIRLFLYQGGNLLTQLVIEGTQLLDFQMCQPLHTAADVDLTITIDHQNVLFLDSPQKSLNLSGKKFGPLRMPKTSKFNNFSKTLKKLHDKDVDGESIEREMSYLGNDLAKCLPDELRTLLSNGTIKTLLISHDVSNSFPFELVLLERDGNSFFLGDKIAVCRWLRNINNAPYSGTKTISTAALMQGHVSDDLAKAEVQFLGNVCSTKPFYDEPTIRREVFSEKKYDLIQFFGHCKSNDTAGAYLELRKGMITLREIGALPNERRFSETAPFVVINGCGTSKVHLTLSGPNSFNKQFLQSKATLCLSTLWPVDEEVAHAFTIRFYQKLASGMEVGEAVLQSKTEIACETTTVGRSPLSDDQQRWRKIGVRSYCLFAHPSMKIRFQTPQSKGQYNA